MNKLIFFLKSTNKQESHARCNLTTESIHPSRRFCRDFRDTMIEGIMLLMLVSWAINTQLKASKASTGGFALWERLCTEGIYYVNVVNENFKKSKIINKRNVILVSRELVKNDNKIFSERFPCKQFSDINQF